MSFHCASISALALCACAALANQPPLPPVITEPLFDGKLVNAADVHMETAPFSDPDAGDVHTCSDWEIWTVSPGERVWVASCVGDPLFVHIHLGDGTFENSHSGFDGLLFDASYRLRVRHRDSSGDIGTQWSAWSERLFSTFPEAQVLPLELDDVSPTPTPTWTTGSNPGGAPVLLPAGVPAPELRVESGAGVPLLRIVATDGQSNQIIDFGALPQHVPLRVVIDAGAAAGGLLLPQSSLRFVDDAAAARTVYLPTLSIPAGQQRYFWISSNGSSYVGDASQSAPVFDELAQGAPTPWDVLQPGFVVDVFASGFQLPVSVAFPPSAAEHPDGPYCYVAELYGAIKVVTHDGVVSTYASNLLNFNPTGDFPGSGELGLASITVDPSNGDLIGTLLYDANPPNVQLFPRVVRFKSTDGGFTASQQINLISMVGEAMSASHQISNVSFGPDGKLYVHVGDGFNPNVAQNLNSYRGKVLRMNPDGTAPSDNPFYNAANGINAADYVWAYGFRNPFGGAWRANGGQHYSVENGPSVDRFAQVLPGVNYGWDGSNESMFINALYVWDPARAPVNVAFVQPETFNGSGMTADKQDHAFVTQSGSTWATGPQGDGKAITEFVLDANGALVSGPTPLIRYSGSGKATAAGLAVGPDGLYFTDLYRDQGYLTPIDSGANLLRVRFVGAADFTSSAAQGLPPLCVRFSDASTIAQPTGWLWDFGDGQTSTQQNPSHEYQAPGTYTVRLSVTYADGVSVTQKPGYVAVVAAGQTNGLLGFYFNDLEFGGPSVTRIDPVVDFEWGDGSPMPEIDPDTFSVRWAGEYLASFDGLHNFGTISDDGVRLWVNDQLIINNWTLHPPTLDVGSISLQAGVPYPIRMEMFENFGGATARLGLWDAGQQQLDILPTSQLFTGIKPQCPGDFTGDDVVDQQDLNVLLSGFGTGNSGDVDCDGDTDQIDLNVLLSNFGGGCE